MYCIHQNAQGFQEVSCDTPDALVVLTRVELAQYSPFYMDIESAVAIGGAILLVMSVAFVLRLIRQALN